MNNLKQSTTATVPFMGALVVLALIAVSTGAHNIADVVRAATRKWNDMIGVPTLLRQFVPAIIALAFLTFELFLHFGGGMTAFSVALAGVAVTAVSAVFIQIRFDVFLLAFTYFIRIVFSPPMTIFTERFLVLNIISAASFTFSIKVGFAIFPLVFTNLIIISFIISSMPFAYFIAIVSMVLTASRIYCLGVFSILLPCSFAFTRFTFRLHPIFARFLSIPEFGGRRVDCAALGALFCGYIRGMIRHSFSPSATEEPVGVDAPRLALFVPFIIPQMRGETT